MEKNDVEALEIEKKYILGFCLNNYWPSPSIFVNLKPLYGNHIYYIYIYE